MILKSIALMIVSSGVLTLNDSIVKWLTQIYPIGQILTVRGALLGMFIIAVALLLGKRQQLAVRNWRLQLYSGGCMAAATIAFVTALSLMPIADAVALTFAGPVIATGLAALLLGEQVGWRRWSAVLIGFIGVVAMIDPGGSAIQWEAVWPLAAALFSAARDILSRKMSRAQESTLSITLITTLAVAGIGLAVPGPAWRAIEFEHWLLFLLGASLLGAALITMIESLRLAEVSLVGPFRYSSLLWAAGLGWLIWNELPPLNTWLGASLVIGAGIYIARRELQLAKRLANNSSA